MCKIYSIGTQYRRIVGTQQFHGSVQEPQQKSVDSLKLAPFHDIHLRKGLSVEVNANSLLFSNTSIKTDRIRKKTRSLLQLIT